MIPKKLYLPLVAVAATALVSGGSAEAQVGKKKTGDKRVAAALDEAELKYEMTPDGDFKLIYELEDDRTQAVYINSNTEKLGTLEIREVWSIAMNADEALDADTANDLLLASDKVKIGGWRVQEGSEGNNAVYFAAQIDAETDADTLAQVIQAVVQTADTKELELTEEDEF